MAPPNTDTACVVMEAPVASMFTDTSDHLQFELCPQVVSAVIRVRFSP